MPMFFRKKEPNRQVFGFLCDRALALRIKMLARAIEVPIYTFCEHLLQLGLAHISTEIGSNLENLEPVKKELREHLINYHLLVKKLGEEQYEQGLIARHAELTPEQQEQVNAVTNLVKKFEDEGIPHGLAIEIIGELVTRLERRRRARQLQQEIDFKVLRQIHQRFPQLIPALQKLMAEYPSEELERALRGSLSAGQRYYGDRKP